MFACDPGGYGRPAYRWFVIAVALLVLASERGPVISAAFDEPSDETQEIQKYRQFLRVLFGNPRFGTAYDRVYEFHANRGTIQDFRDALAETAGLKKLSTANEQQTRSAISEFTQPPDPGVAAVLVGMLDLQHVDGETAVAALTHAARLRPENAITHWYLGKARVMNRQLDLAPESFERAIELRPARTDLLEIYKDLARTLQRTQQDARALDAWRRLENLFPGDLRVKEQIAVTLAQDGHWQDALARYEAIASESKNPDQRVQASLSASDLMIQLGRRQDALTLLERELTSLDPDSWLYKEVRRRIEATFRSRNDLPGLVEYYELWIKAHSEDVDAMARLGRTLSLQNRTADAAAMYRRAIQLAPSNIALRESLIEQLVRDNQFADAIVQYEQMAKFDSGNPDHIEDWGHLYLSQKDVPQEERQSNAAAIWERLLTNRSDDPVTIARLAALLRHADLRDRSIELYQLAIEKAPNDPQYREYLGEYLHQLKRTDEAIVVWKEIAAGTRRSKTNLIRLAEVLDRFGQTELAIAAIRDACSLNPEIAERIRFVEMLRNAAESGGTGDRPQQNPATHAANSRADGLFTEAFSQLDLAEQSAETFDERQQVLLERVKTLLAAGQLEEQTRQLAVELKSGTNVTAERWRILALYQDAADKLNDAAASAMKVVELEPQSIPGWKILADLYERTGRPGEAVAATASLIRLDRRGISEYLRKTARFQIQLGEFDNAIRTGREVIKATPGNPEAYQFFADLAFEVGQPQDAVAALRQAVRVNPGDEPTLRALAKTLADEFQTPEAIDLYWRAFEKARDLESQTNIIVALSNLYLRSNRFPELIERLELRSREMNVPTEMTRCISTAYREAGNFRKSRETLERLMIDESQNVDLLKELRTLAEQEHNWSQTEQYQRQIVELTGGDVERRLLIEILGHQSLYDEAAKERLKLAESRTDRADILKEIEILVSGGYDDVAEMLCQRLMEASGDDWEALSSYRGILLRRHQLTEARDVSRRIIRLPFSFDVPSSLRGQQPAPEPAIDTAESFEAWLTDSLGNPAGTFGSVYCDCALSLVFRIGASATPEDIAGVFSPHLSERDQLRLVAYLTRSVNPRTPASSELWTAMKTFIQGPPGPARTAVQLFHTCQRYAANDLSADGQQLLKTEAMRLLKSLIIESPAWLNQSGLPILAVLPKDGAEKEIAAFVLEPLTVENSMTELGALWSVANTLQSPRLLKPMFTIWNKRLLDQPTFAAQLEAAMTNDDFGFEGGAVNLQLFQNDPESLITMLEFWETLGLSATPPARQTGPAGFLTLPEILIDQFGEAAGINLSNCLQALVTMHAENRVEQWLRTKAESTSAAQSVNRNLIRAELARQLGDSIAEMSSLIDAAAADPAKKSIRFLIAEKSAQLGMIDESVLLLDSLNLTDGLSQIAREEFVLRQLLPAGQSERCVIAANRLFGLPLDMDQQRALIPVLDKLRMPDKVAAMQARFGRGLQDRQSILGRQLQMHMAQNNNEIAGEVAWELLKLSSGGSLFSGHRPDDDRDDGGERLQAIKGLERLNRLQPLIDRYEAMLEMSPGSVDLLEILAEFHEAAEQWDLLAAKRDRIALLSKKASPGLKARALELERSGDVDGACDIYLTILKEDPAAFSQEMETYVQAFERAGRQADFLTAVLSLKAEYWNEHAGLIINIVAELARSKKNDDVVHSSIAKLLAAQKTRRLAIGSLLARPDVIHEGRLIGDIQLEIQDEARIAWSASFNEMSLIIQRLRDTTSLQAVADALAAQILARDVGAPGSQLLATYVDARLNRRDAVMRRLEVCLTDTGTQPELRQLVVLNQRLKELGSDWNDERLWLLERMSQRIADDDELADSVLEELGAVYETTDRISEARSVLNLRVRRMLNSTGADRGNAAESIRELLQAAEKIQHSGFPIEGARLLLNATAHNIDEFTSGMDDDRAVAFKSRFYASQRWARQQITTEKLVTWFELAVQNATRGNGHTDLDIGYSDLLLELSGTTDPRTRDATALRKVHVSSAILTAIEKQAFDDEASGTKVKASIRTLLANEHPPAALLTVALALAVRLDDAELRSSVSAELSSFRNADSSSGPRATSPMTEIPQALRSAPDLPMILAAKMLLPASDQSETIRRILEHAAENTESIENLLVRIAVLNDCLATATQANLTELTGILEAKRDVLIAEQISAVSAGAPGSIDLRREIRQRLLGLD